MTIDEWDDEENWEIACLTCGHEQKVSELRDGCCTKCDAAVEGW